MRKLNGPEIVKLNLRKFWTQFNFDKTGIGYAPEAKLEALVELSRVVIPYDHQIPVALRRDRFNQAKRKLHPLGKWKTCFVCGGKASCRHHIIQLQNGGHNGKKNMVSLCDGCHSKIHPWLEQGPSKEANPFSPTISRYIEHFI